MHHIRQQLIKFARDHQDERFEKAVTKMKNEELRDFLMTVLPLMTGGLETKYKVIEELNDDVLYMEMCHRNVSSRFSKRLIKKMMGDMAELINQIQTLNLRNEAEC